MQEIQVALNKEREKRRAFYNDVTDEFKVEFINGEIIMHSPVMLRHNLTSSYLFQLLKLYCMKHKSGFVGYEKIMTALTRNDYEPDICYFNRSKSDTFNKNKRSFQLPI